ncbi:MAG: signal peptidase I [Gammaproteobacteria bacterium]|nr:signal peptidase I [Gammaproteobacteria bacterium]
MKAKKSWLRSEMPQFIFLVVLVFAGRSTLADHYLVPTGSMEETLQVGDRVVVDKRAHGLRVPFTNIEISRGADVTRGEVVIFDSPRNGIRLIKRIVAIGGDEVLIRNGHLSINGAPLRSDAAAEMFGARQARLNLRDGGGPDLYIERIPDGMLLAVGDHRGNSLDGRMFGLVSETDIYGRAIAVYFRRGEAFVWKPL